MLPPPRPAAHRSGAHASQSCERKKQSAGDDDESNCVVRILPHSAAAADGELRVGDVVVAVNGTRLRGRLLKRALAKRPDATSFAFTVLSEEWGVDDDVVLGAKVPDGMGFLCIDQFLLAAASMLRFRPCGHTRSPIDVRKAVRSPLVKGTCRASRPCTRIDGMSMSRR